MKIFLLQNIQKHGLATPISYKPDVNCNKKMLSKLYLLKLDINTHLGEAGVETTSLYIPVFKQNSLEAWLKLQTMLQKIIKGQSLKTGPQWYAIPKNLLVAEVLCVFKQQARVIVNETNYNYKLVIEGPTSHFFLSKVLQLQ